jgi:hypothetical protein
MNSSLAVQSRRQSRPSNHKAHGNLILVTFSQHFIVAEIVPEIRREIPINFIFLKNLNRQIGWRDEK